VVLQGYRRGYGDFRTGLGVDYVVRLAGIHMSIEFSDEVKEVIYEAFVAAETSIQHPVNVNLLFVEDPYAERGYW
jgi:hypothetical protein